MNKFKVGDEAHVVEKVNDILNMSFSIGTKCIIMAIDQDEKYAFVYHKDNPEQKRWCPISSLGTIPKRYKDFKAGDRVIMVTQLEERIDRFLTTGIVKRVNDVNDIIKIVYESDARIENIHSSHLQLKSEYDMQNKAEKKLIPFDLERAKKGDNVITARGEKVTQLTIFECSSLYPIGGVVQCMNTGPVFEQWNTKGQRDDGRKCDRDLFMAPVEKTGWIGIYEGFKHLRYCGSVYANEFDVPKSELICTKQITWEE